MELRNNYHTGPIELNGTEDTEYVTVTTSISPKYSIGHATLTANGNIIYFSSDMPGVVGGSDIWFCEKQNDGTWGAPKNCGININTVEEEAFPRMGNDDQLYYSSKGKVGMGGYDIFVSQGKMTYWTEAENLKSPINSTSDDFYLTTKDGLTGYLSSNREGGAGSDDIFSFSRIKVPIVPTLRGLVIDKNTRKRIGGATVNLNN